MKCLMDSYSWIEYFNGTDEGLKVRDILGSNECFTLSINLAEVISKFKRMGEDTDRAYDLILANSKFLAIGSSLSKNGGLLHAEIYGDIKDMGLADCLLLQAARDINAKVVTGDRHFKDFKEAILIR